MPGLEGLKSMEVETFMTANYSPSFFGSAGAGFVVPEKTPPLPQKVCQFGPHPPPGNIFKFDLTLSF